MLLRIILLFLFFSFAACAPSQQEIEKQEVEYDRIADSVLKNSLPVDSTISIDTTLKLK